MASPMQRNTPEVTDHVDEDAAGLLKMVAATEDVGEPNPEPQEVFDQIMADGDEEEIAEAIAAACRRVALEATNDASPSDLPRASSETPSMTTTVVEEVLVAIEEDEPSWLETKLGPWVARHRNGLRVSLLALLALYVSLFLSMILQDGLRGLSERSPTAVVRDLIWAALMGIIVLLTVGKHY